MSRIGKKILEIPEKVEITQAPRGEDMVITVKGPLGTVSRTIKKSIKVLVEGKTVSFERETGEVHPALWGTASAHLSNMIEGVTKGFEKKLQIEGIGYRAELSGTNLVFALGFSHPVKIAVPKELTVTVEKNIITIKGSDKDQLGQFAAGIVAQKKPEPYKGKGILYQGQYVRRKQGKRSAA